MDGDVYLYQTNDGGEIDIVNGTVNGSAGLDVAAYLSLFGGEENDSGLDSDPHNWWGNLLEIQPKFQYRSRTQYLLKALPPSSANLRRVELAAKQDLQWLIDDKIASKIKVVATIPGLNTLHLTINIDGDDFLYTSHWRMAE